MASGSALRSRAAASCASATSPTRAPSVAKEVNGEPQRPRRPQRPRLQRDPPLQLAAAVGDRVAEAPARRDRNRRSPSRTPRILAAAAASSASNHRPIPASPGRFRPLRRLGDRHRPITGYVSLSLSLDICPHGSDRPTRARGRRLSRSTTSRARSPTTSSSTRLVRAACARAPAAWSARRARPQGEPVADNPAYLEWLISQSMLNDANELARQLSGSGSMLQNPFAHPDPRAAIRRAGVWFTAYPLSFVTRPGQSFLAALGRRRRSGRRSPRSASKRSTPAR